MNACIYCGSQETLNTEFNITVEDGVKAIVQVCDACADEATPKTAKAKWLEKQTKVKEFMAQAAALGLRIVADDAPPPGSRIIPVTATPINPQQRTTVMVEDRELPVKLDGSDGGVVMSTMAVDALNTKPLPSISGSVDGVARIGSHQKLDSDKVRRELPADVLKGKVRMEQFAGRGGQPIALPATRVDGTGVTNLRIVDSGGDVTLQRRFKSMADDSRADRSPDFRNEYDIKVCPICDGQMTVLNAGILITCPKCKGSGTIN